MRVRRSTPFPAGQEVPISGSRGRRRVAISTVPGVIPWACARLTALLRVADFDRYWSARRSMSDRRRSTSRSRAATRSSSGATASARSCWLVMSPPRRDHRDIRSQSVLSFCTTKFYSDRRHRAESANVGRRLSASFDRECRSTPLLPNRTGARGSRYRTPAGPDAVMYPLRS